MNRTGDKGQPCRSPTCTGNRSDLHCKPSSCSGRTETEQPLAVLSKGPGPHTHGALPTEYHEGHGRMPSPDPQSTCGLVGQTPINPQAPCWSGEYRAGPVFHTTGTKTALFLLNPEGRRHYRPNSPLQYPTLRYCPQPPCNVAEACQPRQPHNIQRLEVLRADLIHPGGLPCHCKELVNYYLSDFGLGDGRVHLRVPSLCFLTGRQVGGIEEILEVRSVSKDKMAPKDGRRRDHTVLLCSVDVEDHHQQSGDEDHSEPLPVKADGNNQSVRLLKFCPLILELRPERAEVDLDVKHNDHFTVNIHSCLAPRVQPVSGPPSPAGIGTPMHVWAPKSNWDPRAVWAPRVQP
ncbi:hypothetical protein L3Q82_014511 [Scortum barcoo]|uniref:Uncharacterized protein n=1 Tax=Scortum barcoo TaxID=214431 RepID=A0ACB8W089_9TELE|nr:hypothetical protein L3Q82_014511 [Scortum barcoo]